MRSWLFALVYIPVGYLYMRLRFGKYHKRRLIMDFNRRYYNAGMTVIWMPFIVFAIIIVGWALINVIIYLVSESFSSE